MSSCFKLRIKFLNPHILLIAKTLCVCCIICHTLLFSASGSIHDNISSLPITEKFAVIGFLKFCVTLITR